MNTENLHQRTIYKAKYLPATNTKGARIKLTNLNTNKSIVHPYDYRFNNVHEQAINKIENLLTYLKVKDYFFDGVNCYLIAKNN